MSYKLDIVSPYDGTTYKGNDVSKVKSRKKKIYFDLTLQDLLLILMGFFLGRSIIMHEISPFVYPYFAYMIARRKKSWIAIAVLPGLIMVQSPLYVIRGGFTFLFMYVILGKWGKGKNKTWKLALLSVIPVFTLGLIFQWIKGNYLYDFLLILFESSITFITFFIFSSALPLMVGSVKRKVVSNEELICSAILISLTLLGMNNLEVYGYSIKNILGITFILIFARYFGSGLGATTGVVVGVVTSLSTFVSPAFIGVYAFAGLLAGIFKDLGKLSVGLGFIIGNAVLTFYINGSTEVFIHIEEILVGIVLLLLLPTKIEEKISSIKGMGNYQIERERLYGERIREVTINRLKGYSKVFNQIGKSFEQVAVSNTLSSKNDFNEMFDRLIQDVCYNCSFYSKCWERDFNSTYQGIFILLNKIEGANGFSQEELMDLRKLCFHSEKLAQELNCLYGNYKSNQYWKKQVMESKNLVSQQMSGISHVISDLSNDMKREIVFNNEAEEEVLVAFDKKGIPIKDVMVLEDIQGRYDVTIYGYPCNGKEYCYNDMGRIISEVLGKRIEMVQNTCNGNESKCKVTFKETIKYNINTGVVRVAKNSHEESGDSYTSIPLMDDKHMLALSDGMGSGDRAAKESKTTINLLENFFEAGFNKEIALKTINSILMLRSSDEMFSTIDLAIFDQYSGETEFIKIGAVSTFIKSGDKVEIIVSNTLPVGILDEVNIDVCKKVLQDGDLIIMVTDGVLDSNILVEDKEKWIMGELKKINSRNPQRLADSLFKQIKKESKGSLKDDTTILVAKVWENTNKGNSY